MRTRVNKPLQRWQLSPRHRDPARAAGEPEGKDWSFALTCLSSAGIYARCRSRCPQRTTPPAARSPSADPACCSDSLRSLLPRPSSLLQCPHRHPGRPRAPRQPPHGLSPCREQPRSAGGRARPGWGSHMAVPPLPRRREAPCGGRHWRAAAAGAATPGAPGERSGAGPGELREQPQPQPCSLSLSPSPSPSRAASAPARAEQPELCPAPPRGPSRCTPGAPGVPPRPGPPPPRISPDGLQRQRGKAPVPSVCQSGNLPAPSHSAAASGITGRAAREHKKGNLACLLFALHFEINGIPNTPTPENDHLPSPSPPFCILHRCGEP